MFFISSEESYIDEKREFDLVVYEMDSKGVKTYFPIKSIESFTTFCVENNLYFTYTNKNYEKNIGYIDLNNINEVKNISVDKDIKQTYLTYNMYEDSIYILSNKNNFIEVMKTDKYLNVKNTYTINICVGMEINKVLYFDNIMYVVIKEDSKSASMYKIINDEFEKVISFELNKNKDFNNLFYYNIFLNN